RVEQDLNHDGDSQAESEETVPGALIDPSSRREEDEERRKDEESLGGADEQARDAGEQGMSIERMRAAEADGAVASPERVEKMHVVVEEGKQCRCRRQEPRKGARSQCHEKKGQERGGGQRVGRPVREQESRGDASADDPRLR